MPTDNERIAALEQRIALLEEALSHHEKVITSRTKQLHDVLQLVVKHVNFTDTYLVSTCAVIQAGESTVQTYNPGPQITL